MPTPRNLRSSVIRLAHAKPELRSALLPLLKSADGEYPAWFQNNSVWQVRSVKGEIVIWQVQKGSGSQRAKQPKLLGEYTSEAAAQTEAKKLAPSKTAKSLKMADPVQERVNEALKETGLWDMKELAKHLRAKGDDEAAKLLETRDEANKIRVQSPAFKFIDHIRKDLRTEAHGAHIQEPWSLSHAFEGGDEITISLNDRTSKPVVTLKVDEHGKVKVKKFDKSEWAKIQKMSKGPYADLLTPKLDQLASYLKKHGTHV